MTDNNNITSPLIPTTTNSSSEGEDEEMTINNGGSSGGGRVYYSMDDEHRNTTVSQNKEVFFSCDSSGGRGSSSGGRLFLTTNTTSTAPAASTTSLLEQLHTEAPQVTHYLLWTGILSPWAITNMANVNKRSKIEKEREEEGKFSYSRYLLQSLYYLATAINYITLPYFFFVSIVYFNSDEGQHRSLKALFEYGILIDSLLFLQVAVLIPFLYTAIKDLSSTTSTSSVSASSPVSSHQSPAFHQLIRSFEIQAFKTLLPTCYLFFFIFFVMLVIDLIVKFNLSIENLFRVNLLEYVSICAITATLLFVSVDCRVGVALIDRLIGQVKGSSSCPETNASGVQSSNIGSRSRKGLSSGSLSLPLSLTMSKLKESRQEIDSRVQRHSSTITWIVLVAVLNIIYLLVVDIISTKWTATELLELLPWKLASYFKEIAFLMVLFNESAKLNEKADELTHAIANQSLPGDSEEDDSSETQELLNPMEVADIEETGSHHPINLEVMQQQVRRLTLINALSTKPISFPIAGRRWTKMDMLLQVMTVVVTTLIVVTRAIVIGNAT